MLNVLSPGPIGHGTLAYNLRPDSLRTQEGNIAMHTSQKTPLFTLIVGALLLTHATSAESGARQGMDNRLATGSTIDPGFNNDVRCIGNYNGDLVVGGYFTTADSISSLKVAGFDGSSWYSMSGFPLGNPIYWLHEHDGRLYAGQALTQLNSWDGASWTAHEPWLGQTFGNIWALETYGNELIVGGGFTDEPTLPSYIAIWNGAGWDSVGQGVDNIVRVLDVYAGDLIAGGYFTTAGDSAASAIAKWDGSVWHPLGSGVTGGVQALAVYNGDLIVAGNMSAAGGVPVSNIARWDGSAWHALGSGLDGIVEALYVIDNRLIAGGWFLNAGATSTAYIASWDGATWSAIGGGFDNRVYGLGEYNGYLIAGGRFTTAGGYVAMWDNSTWRPVGDIATAVDDDPANGLPAAFSLGQNYPNPFNPETTIDFTLPVRSRVVLDIVNTAGQQVRRLIEGNLPAGPHSIIWNGLSEDGSSVASGIYFYRLQADDIVRAKKMILLK